MRKRILALFILLALLISALTANVAFASVPVKASISGGGTYEKGQTITVYLKYEGTTFGSATARFTYNSSILQLISSSDGPQSASGVFYQSVINENGVRSLTCSATFKAVGTGQTSISAEFVEGATLDFQDISANNVSTTVSVKSSSPSVSGNANLSYMSVSAGSLSPSFSPSVTSYTVNVGSDVTVCTISADTQDSNAVISVSGSKELKTGKNVRSVTVTAENGTTKTYTITIYRTEGTGGGDEEEKPGDDEQQKIPEDIKVSVGDKEYILAENISENDVPKGFTITSAMYGEYEIPVIKDSELKYTLAMLKDPETGDGKWFFYDEENDTFSSSSQISAEDAMRFAELAAYYDNKGDEPSGIGMTDKILLAVLGVTAVALAAAVIALRRKSSKRNKSRKTKSLMD